MKIESAILLASLSLSLTGIGVIFVLASISESIDKLDEKIEVEE